MSEYPITEERYQQIVKEELVGMLREKFGDEVLQENFFTNLIKKFFNSLTASGKGEKDSKDAAGYLKNVGTAYSNVYKSYGELLNSVIGVTPDDNKAPKLASPKDVATRIASGDVEKAEKDTEDLTKVVNQLLQRASSGEEKSSAEQILKQLDDIEKALANPPEEVDRAEDIMPEKTGDTEALLDIIDKVADDWDKIQASTDDENLKKAMGYIEKIALAEVLKLKNTLTKEKK